MLHTVSHKVTPEGLKQSIKAVELEILMRTLLRNVPLAQLKKQINLSRDEFIANQAKEDITSQLISRRIAEEVSVEIFNSIMKDKNT